MRRARAPSPCSGGINDNDRLDDLSLAPVGRFIHTFQVHREEP
jgi:hypothetical protein